MSWSYVGPKVYGERFAASWQSGTAGILEACRVLAEAKAKLVRSDWKAMVQTMLPMKDRSTFHRLRVIGQHPVLMDRANVSRLPPSWRSLYELTQLEPSLLEAAIADGRVNAGMMREGAVKIRLKLTPAALTTAPVKAVTAPVKAIAAKSVLAPDAELPDDFKLGRLVALFPAEHAERLDLMRKLIAELEIAVKELSDESLEYEEFKSEEEKTEPLEYKDCGAEE
jgi:hypothetical protein